MRLLPKNFHKLQDKQLFMNKSIDALEQRWKSLDYLLSVITHFTLIVKSQTDFQNTNQSVDPLEVIKTQFFLFMSRVPVNKFKSQKISLNLFTDVDCENI